MNGKFASDVYYEDAATEFYDYAEEQGGPDITTQEWSLERFSIDRKKGLKNGSCTVRFLDAGKKVALFSTGEVGTWNLLPPNREGPPSETPVTPRFENTSYEDAVKAFNSCIEIEVPSKKKGDDSVLVYSFPLGTGNIQSMASVVKGEGKVKYFAGRKVSSGGLSLDGYGGLGASTVDDEGIEVGTASMRLKSGKPIVDSSWAKGRRWFWTRREQRGMKNPGYI